MRQSATHRVGQEEIVPPVGDLGGGVDAERPLNCTYRKHAGQQANVGSIELFDLRVFFENLLSSAEVGLIGADNCEFLFGYRLKERHLRML